jgi:RNA polymerase sigma factor (TIGR02999 family)
MRFERKEHTLQPTALVNEVYMRLTSQDPAINWQSRQHFFAVCARVMREILVDHARRRLRAKRGGGAKGGGGVSSSATACADSVLDVAITPQLSMDILALHEALERLRVLSPRQATVIEYRYLGGVSVEATAKFLNVSPKTVKRDTTIAKAWLYGELRRGNGHRPGKVGKG